MSKLNELKQARVDMLGQSATLAAQIGSLDPENENYDTEYANLEAQFAGTTKQLDQNQVAIDRLERIEQAQKAALLAKPTVEPQAKKVAEKFASFGEQLKAVAHAGTEGNFRNGTYDNRLQALWNPSAAATGHGEATASDGGFIVQEDFNTSLLQTMHDIGNLTSRCRNIPISSDSNKVKLPAIDETSRVAGSRHGGVRAYWMDEAGVLTASQMKFRTVELGLNKLGALTYVTEELLRDASALGAVLQTAFAEEMTFTVENTIMNGDGQGKPLGFLNSGALISVAAESGQAAATVVVNNILKMWNRMPMRSRANAVWLVNQDVEPQLYPLALAGGGDANLLMFRPAGAPGNDGALGTLMGRPVIPVEYSATLGTVGDITLVDLSSYLLGTKDRVQSAQSMHVRFLYEEMAFRWTYRIDGQPIWRTALTPANGSTTISPYVALATRS